MTTPRVLDVSGLPSYEISSSTPLWWGQVVLAAIEGITFVMLIGIYFYLRLGVDVWPPPGTQLPGITLPTLGLLPFILSAGGSWWASKGAEEDNREK